MNLYPNEPCGRSLEQCPYDKRVHLAYFKAAGNPPERTDAELADALDNIPMKGIMRHIREEAAARLRANDGERRIEGWAYSQSDKRYVLITEFSKGCRPATLILHDPKGDSE